MSLSSLGLCLSLQSSLCRLAVGSIPVPFMFQGQKSRFYLHCFPSFEQLSDEDTLKSAACKKMVTFDLSTSEDTNSTSSVNLCQPKCKCLTGLIGCAQCVMP